MSEKEKAKELIDRFKDLYIVTDYNCNDHKEVAKQCALICVDEIIKTFIEIDPKLKYWRRVKNEINKI